MSSFSILKDLYDEHGIQAIIEKLAEQFKIDINVKDPNATITIEGETLTINNANPVSIYFKDGCVLVKTHYSSYDVIKYYNDGVVLKNLIIFPTEDDNLLVLDYYNGGDFFSKRISKTTKDDENYCKGFYEREMCGYPGIPVDCRSHYYKTEEGEEEEKIIEIPDQNLYYHHYSGGNGEDFVESAMCFDTPNLYIAGHIRVPDDLLVTCLHKKQGNIMIRGIILNPDNTPKYHFLTSLDINFKGVLITDIMTKYATGEIVKTRQQARTQEKFFSSALINGIIDSFDRQGVITAEHGAVVKKELERLRDVNLIKNELDNLPTMEIMMSMHDDATELAMDMYDNKDYYDSLINAELQEENGRKLARK